MKAEISELCDFISDNGELRVRATIFLDRYTEKEKKLIQENFDKGKQNIIDSIFPLRLGVCEVKQ